MHMSRAILGKLQLYPSKDRATLCNLTQIQEGRQSASSNHELQNRYNDRNKRTQPADMQERNIIKHTTPGHVLNIHGND